MEFKRILVRPSLGEGVALPDEHIIIDYCQALQRIPPSTEVYTGDVEIDVGTLHASAGTRDAVVRSGTSDFDELVVDWTSGEQHQISENGQSWTEVDGTALKYAVAYPDANGDPQAAYMGILFR